MLREQLRDVGSRSAQFSFVGDKLKFLACKNNVCITIIGLMFLALRSPPTSSVSIARKLLASTHHVADQYACPLVVLSDDDTLAPDCAGKAVVRVFNVTGFRGTYFLTNFAGTAAADGIDVITGGPRPKHAPEIYSCFGKRRSSSISWLPMGPFQPSSREKGSGTRPSPILANMSFQRIGIGKDIYHALLAIRIDENTFARGLNN
jgi:hypothetical protein